MDIANEKIFLMIITKDDIYNITKENTKINYEKLTLILKDFLNSINLKLEDIQKIYVNRGPGSFAGIRNSLSIAKAINIARNVDYYCYSLEDFKDQKDVKEGEVIECVEEESEKLQKNVAEKYGYTLVDHKLELYGIKKKS